MVLAPQIPYISSPASIVNLALDALGQPGKLIGDLSDGSVVSEASRRNYGLVLRGILRTAHWNFARKQASLELLGDNTGQSSVPVSSYVDTPWTYAYAWPTDGVALRWMPLTNLNNNATTNLTTGAPYSPPAMLMPTRFLVSSTDQYPLLSGEQSWASMPDFQRIEGAGPLARRIILSDNPLAQMVYTRLVTTIEEWDPMFRQAMISAMAVVLAPVAIDDPKLRSAERDKHVAIAKIAIDNARVSNGNDAGSPQSTDHTPNWISARSGGLMAYDWNGAGGLYMPWESFSLGGSVF